MTDLVAVARSALVMPTVLYVISTELTGWVTGWLHTWHMTWDC